MEFECITCKIKGELNTEQLKQMYELAGGDLSADQITRTLDSWQGKNCTKNRYHAFNLSTETRDEIATVMIEIKEGNKSKGELETKRLEIDASIERLNKELQDAWDSKDKIYGDIQTEKDKIELGTAELERITGTKNIEIWS